VLSTQFDMDMGRIIAAYHDDPVSEPCSTAMDMSVAAGGRSRSWCATGQFLQALRITSRAER